MNSVLPATDAADRALLERAANWPAHATVEDLTRSALSEIARTHGIDFATALLYHRLCQCESKRVHLPLPSRQPDAGESTHFPQTSFGFKIGVVPGAFYQEYAFTGADGQRVLDAAGLEGIYAERVPLQSFGSLKENAQILRDWVHQHRYMEICLVSLSKGGADVQFALTEPDAERDFRNVSTWINLSGIVQGTALANWLVGQWWRSMMIRVYAWWRRYPFNVVHEIKREGNERLERALAWPRYLRVFHVIGFPTRRRLVNPWALRAHRRLEPWGPSDGGGILLADAVRWPGTLIPLWGVDHYMQDPDRDVADLVLSLLKDHAACGLALYD